MGNGTGALNGLEVDDKAIEITDFWLHHSGRLNGANPQNVSVFISEPTLHSSANFGKPSPLERTAKNLMIHRHPCILKYVSSWRKGNMYHLATEEVRPLVQVIGIQTTLQICIGLHSILRALIFLHEKALASHNNVSTSSIYVTPEGSWKLGGLEFLSKFSDFNQTYLKKIKNFRCEQSIAPEEASATPDTQINPIAIDQFAFGVLIEQVLRMKNSDDVPSLSDFKDFCKQNLQNEDSSLRASLSTILEHPFFTHDFINIHAFLMELPLKTEMEKGQFFSNLVGQLKAFPEKIVAEQLGRLLLSRMVLLDSTAQSKLLPYVLKPKTEDDDSENAGLFTISTFKSCLVPKLLQIFSVRDTSIRLLLIEHLSTFIYAFQLDELKNRILPELLVGIKDLDDHLVSVTLQALAYLVPILGASTVIGGKRGKLFTDGRPNLNQTRREVRATKCLSEVSIPIEHVNSTVLQLPERPSPDGGEDRVESPMIYIEEESTWSDWDTHDPSNSDMNSSEHQMNQTELEVPITEEVIKNDVIVEPLKVDTNLYKKKIVISDITELDIKNSKPINSIKEEVDFFTDMEPVIEKTKVLHVEEVKPVKSRFDVKVNTQVDDDNDDGWGEDLNDWGSDNTNELNN